MKRAQFFFLILLTYIIFSVYNYIETPKYWERESFSIHPEKFEGKNVILYTRVVKNVSSEYIDVSQQSENISIFVSIRNLKVTDDINDGDIVTIFSKSFLVTKGYLEAYNLHIHKNYYWRHFISLFALLIIIIIFLREWNFDIKSFSFKKR